MKDPDSDSTGFLRIRHLTVITRRVTGQSFVCFVCRMVYIGTIFGFYMGTLSSRNTTQMAFCSYRDTTQMVAFCSYRDTTQMAFCSY